MITDTKHKNDCKRIFDRYDPECPRCQELIKGACARRGWDENRMSDAEVFERMKNRIWRAKANGDRYQTQQEMINPNRVLH